MACALCCMPLCRMACVERSHRCGCTIPLLPQTGISDRKALIYAGPGLSSAARAETLQLANKLLPPATDECWKVGWCALVRPCAHAVSCQHSSSKVSLRSVR